jgi:hypothetical protein
VFFVFVGLGLLYGEMAQLQGVTAIALVVVTFAALILVAVNEVRKKRRDRDAKKKEGARKELPPVSSGQPLACVEQRP